MTGKIDHYDKPFPAECCDEGLRRIARLLESCSDLVMRMPDGTDWIKQNVAAVEKTAELAEAAQAAARKLRQMMQRKLGNEGENR